MIQVVAMLLLAVMSMVQTKASGIFAIEGFGQSLEQVDTEKDTDDTIEKISTYEYCNLLEMSSSNDVFHFLFESQKPYFVENPKTFSIKKEEVSLHHLSYYISLFRAYKATNAP